MVIAATMYRSFVPRPSFLILQPLKYLRLMQTWITSTFNPIILSGGVGLAQTCVGPSRHAARNVSPKSSGSVSHIHLVNSP